MARKPTGKPTGRPKAKIDWVQFEQLCAIHCTVSEMAAFLKVSNDTLREHAEKKYKDTFSSIYKKYQESGKCSLRRYQFALAKKNTAMCIWLGKQYLGQTDVPLQGNVSQEVTAQFNALMKQIGMLQVANQSAFKMAEMSANTDTKS